MFQISLPNIIVAYLVAILAIVFGLWIASDWVRKRRDRRNRRFRLVCNICGWPYQDKSRDPIPPCPQCGALNERTALRDL